MWAIAKAITFDLNHVVLAYVLNQSKGHWLLITITILQWTWKLSYCDFFARLEFFNPIETKIFLKHISMSQKVIKVIKPFLEFLKYFDAQCVQNMFAFMLDIGFKVLCFLENLMGIMNAIRLTFEYNAKVVILLLMVYFD